jgi:hypothetical protein
MENPAKNGKPDAKKGEDGGLLYVQLRKLISIVVSTLSLDFDNFRMEVNY